MEQQDLPHWSHEELLNPTREWCEENEIAATRFCKRHVWALALACKLAGREQLAVELRPHLTQDGMNLFLYVGLCTTFLRDKYPAAIDFARNPSVSPQRCVYVTFVRFVQDEEMRNAADKIWQMQAKRMGQSSEGQVIYDKKLCPAPEA